ncbi:hypothetical protein [Aliarcobacter faecis]|nr:hypothetical protein [Aliarcobacter faecis]
MKKICLVILITYFFSGCAKMSENYKPLYLAKPEIENVKEK